MDKKAQASTEYLVILAVVIVVAVVVAGLMGGFIKFGGQTSDKSSKLYWQNSEIGLLDWLMSSTGEDSLVIRNNQQYQVEITNITVNSVSPENISATIGTGDRKTVKAEWSDCEKDAPYAYTVTFQYDNTEFNLTGKSFTGSEKIIGTCQ